MGATPHARGATFRAWAPFAAGVSVKVDDHPPVPLAKEPDHSGRDDMTVWSADVPGARAGSLYKYLITNAGITRVFIDPRSRRLVRTAAGVSSVVVDTTPAPSLADEPALGQWVIYELHVGTFRVVPPRRTGTFADAVARLDYLKGLGVNAVELMPVHQNARSRGHRPEDHNWGYDPVQLFAVNSSYGTPGELKRFVKECHDRGLAVILDVVYNHLAGDNLLMRFGGAAGPGFRDGVYFYGDDREDSGFGPRPTTGARGCATTSTTTP